MGVPTLGCGCAVCTSADPHDRRLRPSVLVRWTEPDKQCWRGQSGPERMVVIDTGPDFREQALRSGLKRVDAVFYTHSHADHILGLDDLRPLSFTGLSRGRADSALRRAGDDRSAGADLRLHLFAGCHLSESRAGAAGAAGREQLRFTESSFCGFRCCMARWRSPAFVWAAPLT